MNKTDSKDVKSALPALPDVKTRFATAMGRLPSTVSKPRDTGRDYVSTVAFPAFRKQQVSLVCSVAPEICDDAVRFWKATTDGAERRHQIQASALASIFLACGVRGHSISFGVLRQMLTCLYTDDQFLDINRGTVQPPKKTKTKTKKKKTAAMPALECLSDAFYWILCAMHPARATAHVFPDAMSRAYETAFGATIYDDATVVAATDVDAVDSKRPTVPLPGKTNVFRLTQASGYSAEHVVARQSLGYKGQHLCCPEPDDLSDLDLDPDTRGVNEAHLTELLSFATRPLFSSATGLDAFFEAQTATRHQMIEAVCTDGAEQNERWKSYAEYLAVETASDDGQSTEDEQKELSSLKALIERRDRLVRLQMQIDICVRRDEQSNQTTTEAVAKGASAKKSANQHHRPQAPAPALAPIKSNH